MSSIELTEASTFADTSPEGQQFVRRKTDLSIYRDNSREGVWAERNVLSLDGGGIRGYWTLLVLKRLMKAIGDEERQQAQARQRQFHSFWPQSFPEHVTQTPFTFAETRKMKRQLEDKLLDHCDALRDARKFLPCHYFDLICGSSTGSLIAIMLSRFRMTVVDCLDEYENMGHHIFGKPRPLSQRNIGIVPWPKYSADAMERVFKDVAERRRQKRSDDLDTSRATFKTIDDTCAIFVTTKRRIQGPEASAETTYLIRSYDHLEKKNNKIGAPVPRRETINFGKASTMEVWEVARAATAAPMYFKEIKSAGMANQSTKVYFSDGGFGHTNNPTKLAIDEIEKLYGGDKVGVVVSVATARADDRPGGKSFLKRVKQAFSDATNPQHVADQLDGRPNYWRFNDHKGLNIELDEWKPSGSFTNHPGHETISTIKTEFNRWARKRSNIRALEECARELVRRRRQRAENGARWERFALCAQFRCQSNDCSRREFENRSDFEAHYEQIHADDTQNAIELKEPEAEFWEYQPASQASRNAFTK